MAHYEKYLKNLGLDLKPIINSAPQTSWMEQYVKSHNSLDDEINFQQIDPNTGIPSIDSVNVQIQPGALTPESIEDAFLKLVDKYQLINVFGKVPAKEKRPFNMADAFKGCTGFTEATDNYTSKTFTLDEVIKIIEEYQSNNFPISTFNQWDNDTTIKDFKRQLIDRFKLL
jgi:hypothetical protein